MVAPKVLPLLHVCLAAILLVDCFWGAMGMLLDIYALLRCLQGASCPLYSEIYLHLFRIVFPSMALQGVSVMIDGTCRHESQDNQLANTFTSIEFDLRKDAFVL